MPDGTTPSQTTSSTRHVEVALSPEAMRDLAPAIHRQRLVVEGIPARPVDDGAIRRYLTELSERCHMRALVEPTTHRSDRYGWAGWIHWETSGAHFYAWDRPVLFFSVDLYTCKPFEPAPVIDFTAEFFDARTVVASGF